MFPTERRDKILDHLRQRRTCSTSELSKSLQVSEVTIYRDLTTLDRRGLVTRVRGGAVSINHGNFQPQIELRMNVKKQEKMEIAKKAIHFIKEESSIFLDHSSTCIYLAMQILSQPHQHLTVVTNSVKILNILEENSRIDVISTGGTLQRKWSALAGPITLGSLSGMNFDQIYVSCGGLSIERGLMTSFAFIADILRRVSKVTREINLLADSSKFSKVGTFSIMPITQMTRVITDKKLENHVAKNYRDIGVELIV